MTNKISTKVYVADFRVGGKAKLVMHDHNGKERTNEMVFREIKPNVRTRYDLKTDFLPGKTLAAEETFQDYMDMTMYKAKLSFPEQEDLCKMMEVGWHLLFREYVARFGAMVEEMKKESAAAD